MIARGKWLRIARHADDGMQAERPPIDLYDLENILEDPDHDDGHTARRRIGRRTIFVYYHETNETIVVLAVSATTRRLAP